MEKNARQTCPKYFVNVVCGFVSPEATRSVEPNKHAARSPLLMAQSFLSALSLINMLGGLRNPLSRLTILGIPCHPQRKDPPTLTEVKPSPLLASLQVRLECGT